MKFFNKVDINDDVIKRNIKAHYAVYNPIHKFDYSMDYPILSKMLIHNIFVKTYKNYILVEIKLERSGILIGKGGSDLEELKKVLSSITKKEVRINLFEFDPFKPLKK